jgi:hypothetical protein
MKCLDARTDERELCHSRPARLMHHWEKLLAKRLPAVETRHKIARSADLRFQPPDIMLHRSVLHTFVTADHSVGMVTHSPLQVIFKNPLFALGTAVV